MIFTVIIFLLVLSFLVFVHEAGHFFAAKLAGIGVEEFGFGFPPRALSIKRGKTIYSLNWIPLGGFVRLKSEIGASTAPDAFTAQPFYRRLIVMLAGVVMNFALAILLFSVGFGVGVPQELTNLMPGAKITDRKIQIVAVIAGEPAAAAGIKTGDEVAAMDGAAPANVDALRAYIAGHSGQEISLNLKNSTGARIVKVKPETIKETGKAGIGVGLFESGTVSYPWYLAPAAGARASGFYAWEILKAFGGLVRDLVTTGRPGADVSGPVGIAVLTGEVVKLGAIYLIQFVALLSLNLGIINALPIPALDGGRVVFLVVEKFRGRPVRPEVEDRVHQIGFALLLILVLVVTVQDILRFFR